MIYYTKEKINGVVISFDPNLRELLWNDLNDAVNEIKYGLSKCNVLKISDNETEFLLGHSDFDRAAAELFAEYSSIKLIFITLGDNGSCAYTRTAKAKAPVFSVDTTEKTGAGDTFFGCAINCILDRGIIVNAKKIFTFTIMTSVPSLKKI